MNAGGDELLNFSDAFSSLNILRMCSVLRRVGVWAG